MDDYDDFVARQYFLEKYGFCPYCEMHISCALHKRRNLAMDLIPLLWVVFIVLLTTSIVLLLHDLFTYG